MQDTGSATAVFNANPTNERLAGRKAAWLVAAIVVIAMALRPGIASIGPVLPLISREFSLSHATASLLSTIPALLMGMLALPTPWLARRLGRNELLVGSLVLLFVSMMARSFVSDVTLLLLTTGGVGAGIAISGTLFAGIIKARFASKVAMMMSVYTTALAASTTISAAATGPIAEFANSLGSSGWRVGTGVWSPIALIAILAALGILVWERQEPAHAPVKSVKAVRLPLKNPTAWLVAIFFACDNFLFFAFLAWTSPIYREHGLSAPSADLVLATFTVVFTAAMPVFGLLSREHDRRAWLAVCAVLSGIGTLGMALAPSLIPHIWIAIAAVGVGGAFTLGMTLPLDNAHSADEANTWNAFMMTVGYLLAATGPLLVGLLRDATGTFQAPFWLMFTVALGMLVLTPFLAPRKHDGST